jgi:hypothetical protein
VSRSDLIDSNGRLDLFKGARRSTKRTSAPTAFDINAVHRRRLIVSDGKTHYVMRRDGTYSSVGVPTEMLLAMVLDLDMWEVLARHLNELCTEYEMDKFSALPDENRAAVELMLSQCATPARILKIQDEGIAQGFKVCADGNPDLRGEPGDHTLYVPSWRIKP